MESATDAVSEGPQGPHVGAFFDVDGTLVDGFTAVPHAGHRIKRRQARIGEVLGIVEAATRYRLGRMEFERLVVRAAGYLRGESLADLDVLGADLFTRRIESRMFPQMRDVVAAHQRRGHTVVILTSALNIHIDALARSLGITHVLCNHFAVDADGRLTGDIKRPIIWGTRKAEALLTFSEQHQLELQSSYFYSDGEEDLPSMRLVGNPRPVNPRRTLAATAADAGWPVLRVSTATSRGA
ncbi:haloacid dehalogenase [Mycobacterium sp. MS1601]|uniref:HAD family hydrolase n=1 Tax=Mycobacterium sp. MS1601 TaxID=1936029 RepID=UPI00097942F3|nr:HAD-IB family hydrolase [Mycobacterium sp. MS1601]AQA03387.1 haloacid dehalogenase [Mycobacterium sp. MS1601]